MEIKYSKRFLKQLKKSPKKIQRAFIDRQDLLVEDKNHPVLRKHSLKGKFSGLYSINVSGGWRALYKDTGEEIVIFELIGTHSQLY